MKCYLCDRDMAVKWEYNYPDKYQELIGIKKAGRAWHYCNHCELYAQKNELTDDDLDKIYKNYRNLDFRGKTVKEEFNRILEIKDSENDQRIDSVICDLRTSGNKMLDIGSGLGVFPYGMRERGFNVTCMELNPDSYEFLMTDLGFNVVIGEYNKIHSDKYDLITLVHVLEHLRDPIQTLKDIKERNLGAGGSIYIEVPDADEFEILDPLHDDFNSTHLFFFTIESLKKVIEKAGLKTYTIRRTHYPERGLERIGILCS